MNTFKLTPLFEAGLDGAIPDPGNEFGGVAGFSEGAGDPLQDALPTGGVVNVGPAAAVGTVGHAVDAPPFVHPHMDNQFTGDLVVEYYIIRSLVLQDFDLTLA